MRRALSWLRNALGQQDRRDAYGRESRAVAAAASRPGVDARFRQAMLAAAEEPHVLLGHAVSEKSLAVRLTLRELFTHALVLGASGSGKTRLVCHVVLYVLREIARDPNQLGLVLGDFKGEFVQLVTELVADMIDTLPPKEADALLERWVVFNPFSSSHLLPMQLLKADPCVPPEIQAAELTTVIERLGGAPLGVKQDSYAYALVLLGILEGLNLLDVRHLLTDLLVLETRARNSASLEVRQSLGAATKLPRASLEGVRVRLERLLRLPSMRLILGAKDCTSFRELVNERILVADVGSPPLGCSDLASFWTGFVTLKLTRSIFERTKANTSRPVLIIIDEFQEGLSAGGDVAEQFERVLSMARSRAAHLWMVSQSLVGVAKVSQSLPEVVSTNANLQILGRASPKDARTMGHLLPVTGRCRRNPGAPWDGAARSPFLSATEERELLIERLPNQANRSFYFWDRRNVHRAELIRSASIEPSSGGFRSVELIDRLTNGALAVSTAELGRQGIVKEVDAFEPVNAGAAELVGRSRRPKRTS